MYVLRPRAISDANLTSNIPEPDTGEQVWSAGTTYAKGNEVISTSTHRVYRSVIDSNTGNDPTTDDGTKWTNIRATNKYRMFDNVIGSQSNRNANLTVTIAGGQLTNAASVFNVSAQTANVTMNDPSAGEVYNRNIEMRDNSEVTDWYTYFFEPIVEKKEFSLWDLPAYPSATVTLTLTSTGDVKCGEFVVGKQSELGVALLGTSSQLLNFNTTTRDVFGNIIKTTDRRTAKLTKYNVHTLTSKTQNVFNILDELKDVACVWTGSLSDDKTLTFGYHSDARVNFSNPSVDDVTIEVEGLT